MSENNGKENSSAIRTHTSGKPFCSLAYLAKSTVAVNSKNNVHKNINNEKNIINGLGGNWQPLSSSSVAPAVEITTQYSQPLSTGATTTRTISEHGNSPRTYRVLKKPQIQSNPKASAARSTDIFGQINEEQPNIRNQINHSNVQDPRHSWQISDGSNYMERIPPSLMTGNSYNSSMASLTKLNSLDCWDYTIELECLKGPQDLQLAAELGKTLLERNKELETLLKEHKYTIEEQEQEIVYLKKHTTALREVNDSRLKVYEQLEVGIQELERSNHRLLVENTADKKQIKTLLHNIETLEARCDELCKQLEDARQMVSTERRKCERLTQESNAKSRVNCSGMTIKNESDQASKGATNVSNDLSFDTINTGLEKSVQYNNEYSTGNIGIDDSSNLTYLSAVGGSEDNDEIIKLVNDLEATKKSFLAEQQRCGELEEQLVAIIQENQTLQNRIAQSNSSEEMKSMHDELSTLDEVRKGQMCSRCLRTMDDHCTVNDEQYSIAHTEEGEDEEEPSLLEVDTGNCYDNDSEVSQAAYRSGVSIKVQSQISDSLDVIGPASPNPYRDLVEKYEALLEVQRASIARKNNNVVSIADELQSSGEFDQSQKVLMQTTVITAGNAGNVSSNRHDISSSIGSITNDVLSRKANNSARGQTPTELSESETFSSGFSDETSSKHTQTDDRPGYFLCSIGDGDDCKFSIYDDISPIDSRFRNRPEYRELFKEIFSVLKKAAENKEEGDKLPLLDDSVAVACAKVPPVTPANEGFPVDFADDTQSLISSALSEQSFAMSECVTKLERKTAKKHIIEKNQENKPPISGSSTSKLTSSSVTQVIENERILTPIKREPLEYFSLGMGVKKKNRKKNRNFGNDRCQSPTVLPSPPRFFVASGKKRKEVHPFAEPFIAPATKQQLRPSRTGAKCDWNGSSMVIYNRSLNSQNQTILRRNELDLNNLEYRPSTVSQDLHKLKKLDLSYAEVLRRADACKQHHHQQPSQRQQHRR